MPAQWWNVAGFVVALLIVVGLVALVAWRLHAPPDNTMTRDQRDEWLRRH